MNERHNDQTGSHQLAWLTVAFFTFVFLIVVGVGVCVFITASPNSMLGTIMRGGRLPGVNNVPPKQTSSLKPNEFRLTVRRLVDQSDQLVAHLTIETLQPRPYKISSRGTSWLGYSVGKANCGVVDYQASVDGYFSTTTTLTATQIAYHKTQLARCNLGGGLTTSEVPLKTPLDKILNLTVKDGVYPLDKPLLIGQQFGVDVQVAVGELGKIETMSTTTAREAMATEATSAAPLISRRPAPVATKFGASREELCARIVLHEHGLVHGCELYSFGIEFENLSSAATVEFDAEDVKLEFTDERGRIVPPSANARSGPAIPVLQALIPPQGYTVFSTHDHGMGLPAGQKRFNAGYKAWQLTPGRYQVTGSVLVRIAFAQSDSPSQLHFAKDQPKIKLTIPTVGLVVSK